MNYVRINTHCQNCKNAPEKVKRTAESVEFFQGLYSEGHAESVFWLNIKKKSMSKDKMGQKRVEKLLQNQVGFHVNNPKSETDSRRFVEKTKKSQDTVYNSHKYCRDLLCIMPCLLTNCCWLPSLASLLWHQSKPVSVLLN